MSCGRYIVGGSEINTQELSRESKSLLIMPTRKRISEQTVDEVEEERRQVGEVEHPPSAQTAEVGVDGRQTTRSPQRVGNDSSTSTADALLSRSDSVRKKRRLSPSLNSSRSHKDEEEDDNGSVDTTTTRPRKLSQTTKPLHRREPKGENGSSEITREEDQEDPQRTIDDVDMEDTFGGTDEKKSSSTDVVMNGTHPHTPAAPALIASKDPDAQPMDIEPVDGNEVPQVGNAPTPQQSPTQLPSEHLQLLSQEPLVNQVKESNVREEKHQDEIALPSQRFDQHPSRDKQEGVPMKLLKPNSENGTLGAFDASPQLALNSSVNSPGADQINSSLLLREQQTIAPQDVLDGIQDTCFQAETNTSVPARPTSVLRTTWFWFFAFFFLQIIYVEYWINPILHSVVMGSRSLTIFYQGIIGTKPAPSSSESNQSVPDRQIEPEVAEKQPLGTSRGEIVPEIAKLEPPGDKNEDEADDTVLEVVEPEPPIPDIDLPLVEKKRSIREMNKLIADQNMITIRENSMRMEQSQQRATQISDMIMSNQRVEMENEQILAATNILAESFRDVGMTKSSLIQAVDESSLQVQSILDHFQRQRETLGSLMQRVASRHRDAARELASTESVVVGEREHMNAILTVLTEISEGGTIVDQKDRLAEARELLGESEELLLDVFSFDLWKPSIPASDCPTRVVLMEESSAVAVQTVVGLLEDFKAEISVDVEDLQRDEDLIDSIHALIHEGAERFPLDIDRLLADIPKLPAPALPKAGPSLEEIQEIVLSRLAKENADRTGRVDFASLHNGATIVKQATSPSFVDTLPVLNRMGAMLSIRSYGYGPEASITPTWPLNKLGQCWAFERDTSTEDGDDKAQFFGRLADLTVSLARPVPVDSVSIEHPPQEISDQPRSAIKQFQVIGFEDSGASGSPWHLGTYTYDVMDRRKSSRQDFMVLHEVEGRPVPSLGAITLAIDSNWGAPISCLYRFRVHSPAM